MINVAEIIEKIRVLKKLKSESDVAKLLEIPRQNLSSFKIRNKPPFDQLVNFCERENVSLDWLLLGRGSEKPLPENMGTSAIDELIKLLETFKKTKETK